MGGFLKVSTRKNIVKFVAALLGLRVSFPEEKKGQEDPKDREYRLTREVWFDGTVHWKIEQFVSKYETLKELFPLYPTDSMTKINGRPSPYCWIPHPNLFPSEEEAIEFLNETLRSCEVMEHTHYKVE